MVAEEQQSQRLLEAEEVLNEQGEDFIRYNVRETAAFCAALCAAYVVLLYLLGACFPLSAFLSSFCFLSFFLSFRLFFCPSSVSVSFFLALSGRRPLSPL